ncbi:MAG: preprotein translocase subunit SecA [Patescibacteria group bacterium]|nr:preprotein translocase subunit SecA [Patescibacteria group bacterium]
MSLLDKIFGDPNEKMVKILRPVVEQINALEKKYQVMSDEELRVQTAEFRKRLGVENTIPQTPFIKGANFDEIEKKLKEILPEAFAVVREAAKRVLGQRHYDVQLMGGMVLHHGQIAEMRTGEGKTLVATLPAYLNALPGRGVHVITVNDYLAKRDAEWMGRVYSFLGLSVGCITHEQAFKYNSVRNDQIPITNNQTNPNDQNSNDQNNLLNPSASASRRRDGPLQGGQDGKIPLTPFVKGELTEVPRKEAYNCDVLYGTNNEYGFDYLRDNMAPDLKSMVQRSLNYAIVDEVDSILIDEARTPLIISSPAEESTDKYFKFAELVQRLVENEDYNVDEKMRAATLSETGIAKMEKMMGVDNIYTSGGIAEVHHIEQALKARVLFKRDRDYVVKDGEIIIVDEFTGRLMYGRRYSEGLHQAIEAKERVEVQRESLTLATITFQNYFRIYKKLAGMTGTAVTEAEEFSKIYKLETVVIPTNRPMAREDLNDLIYRTEMGKFKAVVAEVKRRHAIGQPVLTGTISIEKNETLAEMLAREGIVPQVLNAKHHEQEAQIISQAGKLGAVTIATNMAGRGVDIMLGGVPPDKFPPKADQPRAEKISEAEKTKGEEYEKWRKEYEKVKSLGGLHIIGTERHEARRIDNQLRGRAGRQGDPGSSQFYVSMEDDLMRIFGGDRMKNLMVTLRVPEDMPIENGLVSRSIESAQTKVEGNNFDIRKHLVEYDDVINKHRETIYRKRREILELAETSVIPGLTRDPGVRDTEMDSGSEAGMTNKGASVEGKKTLSTIILEMILNEIEQAVIFHTAADSSKDWNVNEIFQVMSTIFVADQKLKEELAAFVKDGDPSAGSGQVKLDKVKVRTKIIEHLEKLIRINYEKITKLAGEAGINWRQVEKAVLIRSIDMLWIEHLEAMDHMRHGIGLRGYGQRDPLIEYKKEAYILFNELNNLIQKQVAYSIFKVADLGNFAVPTLKTRPQNYIAPAKTMEKNSGSFAAFKQADNGKNKNDTVDLVHEKVKDASGQKVGRNDPCPCGSGKKFKKCHGA